MKQAIPKRCISFFAGLILLFIATVVNGQSVYLFQYNFNHNPDTIDYTCLYFRNENGTGLLKLKYHLPNGSSVIKDLNADDGFFADADTAATPHLLAIKTHFTTENSSDSIYSPIAPVFLFSYQQQTGYFEPTGVTASKAGLSPDASTQFSFREFQKDELTKDFALQFFDKNDPFYISYFSGSTRGGTILNMLEQKEMVLHLIVVADTLDKAIGKSAAADLHNMMKTFTRFSEMLGIRKGNFRPQVFAGNNCESKLVINALNRLTPGKNDIVIFYYSGHGFRTNARDSFPYIKSTRINKDSATIVRNSLRIKEDIFNRLMAKKTKARVTIVISDCCNSDIEKPKSIGNPVGKSRGEWELNEKNTRDLFLSFKPVSILLTAAQNGEKAICDPEYNSYMSFSFLAALKQYTSRGEYKVSWAKLLEATGKKTFSISNQVCCSKPCCGPSCTTGKPIRCAQHTVYSIRN